MVIRVLDQNYFVLQTLPSETGLLQYVCRNVGEDSGHIFRIVMLTREQTSQRLIRWLSDIYRAGRFRELTQYASEHDSLQVVVDCGSESAVPAEQLLTEEKPSLKERLSMGSKMLERLILSDVPAFFAIPALDPGHVRFTKSLDCCFTFELEHLTDFDAAEPAKEYSHLRAVLRRLFSEELRNRKMPELKEFLDRLLQQEFSDMTEVYRAWLPIAQKYGAADETKLEAKSLPFVIWEKIKLLARLLKKLFVLVVIGLAVAYLVFSVRRFMAPTEHKDVYRSVGDLVIVNSSEPETEGQK